MTEIDLAKTTNDVEYASTEDLVDYAKSGDDLDEKDVTDVFGGKTVKIRALSAAQAATVNQRSITFGNGRKQGSQVSFAQMDIQKFQLGVIRPSMDKDTVRMLHIQSGRSFQKVLREINELSGIEEDAQERDEEAFPGS